MKCDICLGEFYSGGDYEPPEHCGCGNEADFGEWRLWSRKMWLDLLFLRTALVCFWLGKKLWNARYPNS